MTSWVILRHLGIYTLGVSLSDGSFVVKVDLNWNRISADRKAQNLETTKLSNCHGQNRLRIIRKFSSLKQMEIS